MNEQMSEDEAELENIWMSKRMAYVFEPLTRQRVARPISAEDCGGVAAPDGDGTKERAGRQPTPRTTQLMAQILIKLN